jgi:predicted AAA+ superfamily ATPase
MYSRIINYLENKSFFLFGPRGTGKSTWVKTTFPDAVYIDLLEAELYNDLLANPQRLEKLIPKDNQNWIIIDEVQKIPELLNEVHRLIEKSGYRFILTGSSARKIKKSGQNLLAGRALTYSIHPLTTKELGGDFNILRSLSYGHLPCAYTEQDPKKYLESYVRTYLDEEIKHEGLTRNLQAFSRFLEAASFSQGSVLNVSSVSRECAVERKVVENYFSILEDLLIGYMVPVFAKKAKRKMAVHSKFYFFDAGVFRTLRPMGPLDTPEEAQGAALETLLFQELLALNSYYNLGYKIHYWRTAGDIEVDFVLYGERGIKAFEIKRSNRVDKKMLSGLNAFLEDYPQAKGYFIYGGDRKIWEGKIEIIPASEAFPKLAEYL